MTLVIALSVTVASVVATPVMRLGNAAAAQPRPQLPQPHAGWSSTGQAAST